MGKIFLCGLLVAALASPALAASYPVSGRWGESRSTDKDALIDCSKTRVITFDGNQRTDSIGGVRAFRNKSVTATSPTSYRIVDWFSTGQVSQGELQFGLRKIDDDHIEVTIGGRVKLQRCL
jgi:hypothetical protein